MILELIQNPVKSFNEEKTGYLLLSWENNFSEKIVYLKRMINALTEQLTSFKKEDFSFLIDQFEDFLNNPKKHPDQEKIFFQEMLTLLNDIEDPVLKANCSAEFFLKLHNVSLIYDPIRINFDPKNISFESYQKIFDSIDNSRSKLKQMAAFTKILKKFPFSTENKKFYDYFLSTVKEMIIPRNASVDQLINILGINYFPQDIFFDLSSGHKYTDEYISQSLVDLKEESNAAVEAQIDDFINQFLIDPMYDKDHLFIISKIRDNEFGKDHKDKMISVLKKILDGKISDPIFYERMIDSKNIINHFFQGIVTPQLYRKKIETAPLFELWNQLLTLMDLDKKSTDFPHVQNLIPLIFQRQKKIINEASKEELIEYLFKIKSNSGKITETRDTHTINHQQHSHRLSDAIDPFLIQYNSMLMMRISERLCSI